MAGKMVDLKDKLVSQKLKLKALRFKKREVNPATIFTANFSALITKKKKSLDHLKCFSNGKDLPFRF